LGWEKAGGAGEEHLDTLNESGREKLAEVLDPEAALCLLAEDWVRCKILVLLALRVAGGGCDLRRDGAVDAERCTMRRAARPSGRARCGTDVACSAMKYQSLCREVLSGNGT